MKGQPTTLRIHIQDEPVTKPRNNAAEVVGDFPTHRYQAKTATELARALISTYNTNRLANNIVVRLADGTEASYQNHEFQTRISKFIGAAAMPRSNQKDWLLHFTQPLTQPTNEL